MDESILLQDQLLATKFFVPSSSHPLIARSHLSSLLTESLRRKLTLISAPAGFGKTTLLSCWVQSLPRQNPEAVQVAWVSLDEDDNEPLLFWKYVLTALDSQLPGLCAPLLDHLHIQHEPPLRSVLQALINTLASRTEQLLLVLDDYHQISEPEVHTSLTYLVKHLPPQLHLILATRADPPLPLARLRARGEVLEVRTHQLRCTPEEVMAFFTQMMGHDLPADLIEEVTTRTEGWLAGLHLLGLSLQGHTDPATLRQEMHGSQRYILEYLLEEVLWGLAPSVQTFLLRTSILERLSAALCDALLEQTDSQQMLEELERANLFVVPLDGPRHWYRYHALFAQALRYRLEQTEGEALFALHRRASRWYARQGHLTEAIHHAISAGDWPWTADLIEQAYAFIWGRREHAMVRRWLEQLPIEVVRARPRLCLTYAETLFMVAPYIIMEPWLQDAETALRTIPTPVNETADPGTHPPSERTEWENLQGEIAAYRALITGYHLGDGPATLALCQQALAHLSPQNLVVRAAVAYTQSLASHALGDIVASIQSAREATALASATGDLSSTIAYLCRTAYSLLVRGKLHEVVLLAEQATLLGTSAVGLPHAMVCWASIYHAVVLRQWNRLDEALSRALQAIQLGEQTETIVALYLGYTELMRVYLARGETEAARSAFHRAEETLAKTYSPYRRDVYVIGEWVQFWLASGAVDRAIHWAEELAQSDRGPSPLARERQEVARARILLAQKRSALALSLLEPLQGIAEKQERWTHVIEMKVLQALAYQMHHQEQEARNALSQALRLAEPVGSIRCFVDEGAPMAALLSRMREQERKHGPTSYVDKVLAAFGQDGAEPEHEDERAGERMSVQPLLDPLSERELEVLRLIIRGDSNQEIAQTLVLSIDTVKRHVSNIFSKLRVNNRIQAAARVRVLGLLSEDP
jgi:LuxR family maltose regulon positive regulatory protein